MPNCNAGSFQGRTVAVAISLGCSETAPASYNDLGATRGLSFSGSRGTIDVSSRETGNVREYIGDYLDGTVSIDGLLAKSGTAQSKVVREAFFDSATETVNAWIELTLPEEAGATTTIEVPVILTSYENDFPYDGTSTFSLEAQLDGDVVFTDVPAAP